MLRPFLISILLCLLQKQLRGWKDLLNFVTQYLVGTTVLAFEFKMQELSFLIFPHTEYWFLSINCSQHLHIFSSEMKTKDEPKALFSACSDSMTKLELIQIKKIFLNDMQLGCQVYRNNFCHGNWFLFHHSTYYCVRVLI